MDAPVSGGRCSNVSAWQWSGLSWEIRIRSGSGSSASDSMQGSMTCVVSANLELQTLEAPASHGSMRQTKEPSKVP